MIGVNPTRYAVSAFSALLLAIGSSPSTASPILIDFNALGEGDIVAEQYAGLGVHISGLNYDTSISGNAAMVFDSDVSKSEASGGDSDLVTPSWTGLGNDHQASLENILIISEDLDSSDPDDEGTRPAGELIFDFDFDAVSFGFHLIDVETGHEATGGSVASFFSGATLIGSLNFATDLEGEVMSSGLVEFGNNSINKIDPIFVSEFGSGYSSFDRVKITLGGSGAVDNLLIQQVPEPSTIGLMLIGMVGTALLRRRRE